MNLVKGDSVVFNSPVFSGGSFYRGRSSGAKFVRNDVLTGVIERDSYGDKTGQHTFSIRLTDGSLKRVKGRNLYPNIVQHVPGVNHADAELAKAARIDTAVATGERLPARMRNYGNRESR